VKAPGVILVLIGVFMMIGGFVTKTQFVPEKPYLVENSELSQVQIYQNWFENMGNAGDQTLWQYAGSWGDAIIFDVDENVGTIIDVWNELNQYGYWVPQYILWQENNVWKWNASPRHSTIYSGPIASIENVGYRHWLIKISPVSVNYGSYGQENYPNGIITIELEYKETAFRSYVYIDFRDPNAYNFALYDNSLMYKGAQISLYETPSIVENFVCYDIGKVGQKFYYNYDITIYTDLYEGSANYRDDMYVVLVGFENKTPIESKPSIVTNIKANISTPLLVGGIFMTLIGLIYVAKSKTIEVIE
jgi:hypothetical protein